LAVVDSDILALTLAGMKTNFDQAYFQANEKASWQFIATEIPTTLPIQQYGFLGRGALMEQFYDEVREQGILEKTYSLQDIVYKGMLAIDRRAIEDDQYDLIMLRVRALGAEPVRHWNQLAYQGLATGASNLCYDGQNFFSASHSEGSSGTQSNITSSPLSDAALTTAEQTMMAFVDDKGVPMEIVPDTLVVGPSNARLASDLIGSEIVVHVPGDGTASTGATAYTPFNNYFKGRYRLVVNPYLINTYANHWFLLDTSKIVKPIVIQSRSDVPITVESDMLEPNARIKEKFRFGPRGRYVQGYGLWQTAIGSTA